MRHMEICRKKIALNEDEETTVVYFVTVDDFTDVVTGICLESYGVGITILNSSETEIIPNVTSNKTNIMMLINLLATHIVTPLTARDVVEDWIG